MNQTKNNDAIPNALRDTWKWKASVADETKGMSTADALDLIHRRAATLCEEYGISRANAPTTRLSVAEDSQDYGMPSDESKQTGERNTRS